MAKKRESKSKIRKNAKLLGENLYYEDKTTCKKPSGGKSECIRWKLKAKFKNIKKVRTGRVKWSKSKFKKKELA